MTQIATIQGRAPTLAEMTKTATLHRGTLNAWANDLLSDFLPPAVANQIGVELNSILSQSCPMPQAAKHVARLMVCYPARAADNAADREGYVAVLIEELQEFPALVLAKVLPEIGRSHTFGRPSVAHVVSACREELSPIHQLRHGLHRMERHRTAEQARREEERQKKREEEERAAAIDALAVKRFGDHGVRPGDYAAAIRAFEMVKQYGKVFDNPAWVWRRLLPPDGEWPVWVAVSMRRAGMFGRADVARHRGQAGMKGLVELQRLLVDGEDDAARQMVDAMEARTADPANTYNGDIYRPWPLPAGMEELVEPFRDWLVSPAERIDHAYEAYRTEIFAKLGVLTDWSDAEVLSGAGDVSEAYKEGRSTDEVARAIFDAACEMGSGEAEGS